MLIPLLTLALGFVLSPPAPAQPEDQDPRLTELLSRISAELPGWIRDDDLAPGSPGAWDHKTEAGQLYRISLFKNTMGKDAKSFLEGAALAFPGAHFIGTPREIVTPVATEFRASYEAPGKGCTFVWHETFGLNGKTAYSPGLFAMLRADTPEMLAKIVAEGEPVLRPAFEAYARYAYSLRLEEKSGVTTLTTGLSTVMKLSVPKGWKASADTAGILAWEDATGGTVTLDVHSSLDGSPDDIVKEAVAKISGKPTTGADPHDISFVEGEGKTRRWSRLKVLEEGGYVLVLKASALADKRASFEKAIHPLFVEAKIVPKDEPSQKPPPEGKK